MKIDARKYDFEIFGNKFDVLALDTGADETDYYIEGNNYKYVFCVGGIDTSWLTCDEREFIQNNILDWLKIFLMEIEGE